MAENFGFRVLTLCFLFSLALLLLASGCASRESFEARAKGVTAVITPQPPAFFTGPACVLLTNSGGYSARLTAQTQGFAEHERNFSGQLLGLGSKLFFAPDPDSVSGKKDRYGGFSFIWDVAENRGYALSEALQAYAPVSSSTRVTNVVIAAAPATPQKLAGHTCELAQATVQKDDGSISSFELLRATDLNGLPVKISSITNSTPLTLTFAKIRFGSPGAAVFTPPDGFTKYTSSEAMADELAAREHNLNRKHTEEPIPFSGYPPPGR
jgi:hypothetical protein